jgi:hypothetical protein
VETLPLAAGAQQAGGALMLHSAMPGAMQQPSMVDVKVTAMTPSTTEGSTTEVTRKSFFIKVVCEVSALLPVPNGNGQRGQAWGSRLYSAPQPSYCRCRSRIPYGGHVQEIHQASNESLEDH